jgi:DNA polymerase eta
VSNLSFIIFRYREAGAEVIDVMVNSNVGCVERASIDEAYIDMTDEITRRLNISSFAVQKNQLPNTIVAGFESESGAVGNQG